LQKKSIALITAVLLTAVLAPPAHAIGVFGSYWDGQDTKSGYGLGLIHKFQIIPIVSLDVRASWVDFGDANTSIIPLEATGRAKLGLVYGGVGLGYYIFNSHPLGVEIDNQLGGFAVLGLQFTPAGIGAFGELKYTLLETDVGPVKLDASGLGVNVGVVFNW
jgi:hypothetical protein